MDSEITLRRLDAGLLPAFLPYLIPQAAQAVEEGMEGIIALGAVTQSRKTCGAVAGELRPNGFTVFSLYVDPAMRRRGIGGLLLRALASFCPGARLDARWFLPEEGSQGLSAFFRAQGFSVRQTGTPIYRLETAGLRQAPTLRRAFSPAFCPDGSVASLSSLTEKEYAALRADRSIDPRLRPDALVDRFTPELSFCHRSRGQVDAYLVCGIAGPRELALLAAASRPGAPPAAFLHLTAAALHAGLVYFGGDFTCWLDAVSDTAVHLAQSLSKGRAQLWLEGGAWTGPGFSAHIPPCPEKGSRILPQQNT